MRYDNMYGHHMRAHQLEEYIYVSTVVYPNGASSQRKQEKEKERENERKRKRCMYSSRKGRKLASTHCMNISSPF